MCACLVVLVQWNTQCSCTVSQLGGLGHGRISLMVHAQKLSAFVQWNNLVAAQVANYDSGLVIKPLCWGATSFDVPSIASVLP